MTKIRARIAAVPGDVLVHPAQRLGDVSNQDLHLHVGQQSVVRRDKDEAAFGEHARLDLHVGLVARLPAAAVNPEDDREILRSVGRVNVKNLTLVGRIGVRDVGLEILCPGNGHEQQEGDRCSHGE